MKKSRFDNNRKNFYTTKPFSCTIKKGRNKIFWRWTLEIIITWNMPSYHYFLL